MSDTTFDVIVVGGGPGGYVCAIRLGQLGLSVACVEEEEYGGVCLNWGCIPSKALISTAHLFHKAQQASVQGLSFASAQLDTQKMQSWKDGIVKKLTGGVRQLLKANSATTFDGRGRLSSATTVDVAKKGGGNVTLTARKGIVVATGSETIQVPGLQFDGTRVIGARQAVSLQEVPKRLVVVGGGVIGLELGMVYQAFGAELTIVELTPSLLPGVDAECVRVVERTLSKRGAKIYKSTKAVGYEAGADGSLTVRLSGADAPASLACDVMLVAVGMKPRSRGIGLEELGVVIDERGFVRTDECCRTNVPGVWAIGDVSGAPMLAHKASKEGEVCAEALAGKASAKDWITIPGIIFTDPEIASAGMTDVEAKEQGYDVAIGKFPFAALGRAMSIRETDGFVKLVTDRKTGRILGVHIVGPNASDLISEAALALEMVATAEDMALTVRPHPTLGESLMEAAAASLGHAIHVVNR
ncbi:MAG TPA: dihydrolipoyl dehydrogenase [Polyangiaceae bacterium]|nr:dihydrolipoyl dehydrogenase [Polyangiaceae bacterium]